VDLDYLQTIKSIRRSEFISSDGAPIWDAFFIKNIKDEITSRIQTFDGTFKDIDSDKFIDLITKEFNLKEMLIINSPRTKKYQNVTNKQLHFASNKIIIHIHLSFEDGYDYDLEKDVVKNGIFVKCIANDLDIFEKFCKIGNEFIQPKEIKTGSIFVLKRAGGSLHLGDAGDASIAIQLDNYESNIVDQYNHLLSDLLSGNPCGRLSILSGTPGTGKTSMLRMMFKKSSKIKFVLIRPEMITHLGDPELVTVLLDDKEDDKPFVFVLEDADSCLAERMSDNMGAISAVLNTSDGILGSTLDLRIIATTNAAKVDFDDALMRPGRLCTHIHVDSISQEKAFSVFKRLTGKNIDEVKVEIEKDKALLARAKKIGFANSLVGQKKYTLAEVYKAVYLYNKSLEPVSETINENNPS
jgi:hypothetical protein